MNYSTLFALGIGLCGVSATAATGVADPAQVSLRESARGLFRMGAAINTNIILEKDGRGVATLDANFDSVTPENALKWEHVHPTKGHYDFTLPDRYVEFGNRRNLAVIGHTLMWHSQVPNWVFQDDKGGVVSRDELLARLREHIHTVVGRYRGKIRGWDVVNEAIKDEDGTLRTDKPWYQILGEDGVFTAFAAAHEADPNAELYYNDYSLENPVKRAGVIRLVQAIRAKGLRIDGVGSQEHLGLENPTAAEIDATMTDLANAGFKVMVTELDVTVLPRPRNYFGAEISKIYENAPELDAFRGGLTDEMQAKLASRYADIFAVYARHAAAITRVTFWGVNDGNTWLNGWPIRGRTDHPLLFDREYRPKPALMAVQRALAAAPEMPTAEPKASEVQTPAAKAP
jgi:endo-1,4-beta-xylanase